MGNRLLYLFAITWPLLSIFVVYDLGVGKPAIDGLRILAVIFLIIIFLKGAIHRRNFRLGNISIPCIIFIIFFCLCLVTRNFVGGFKLAIAGVYDLYLVPLAAYLFIINCSKPNFKVLFHCLIFAGVFIAITGILEFFAGQNLIGHLSLIEQTENWKNIYKVYRVNGPFADIIGYGSVLLLYIPFVAFAIKNKITNVAFSILVLVIISIGSLVTLSKANTIVLMALFFLLFFDFKFLKLVFMFFLSTSILIALYLTFDLFKYSNVYQERVVSLTTVAGRWDQYLYVLKLFLQHPIFGIGYGQFLNQNHIQVHNSFLKQLVELGAFGFIPYMIFILSIIFSDLRRMIFKFFLINSKVRWGIVLIVVLIGSTIDLLWNKHFMLALMMIVGFIQLYERENIAKE